MARRETTERRARFVAALEMTGTTQQRFAERLDVTREHLRLVLDGRRRSPRVIQAVDEYIRKHAPKGEGISEGAA